jgi:Spy/CpxP family protein refolding chaperone
MMKKMSSVQKMMVITLVILFAGASVAMAGFGGRGKMGAGGGFHMRALMELDLEDDQKAQIVDLIEAHRQGRQWPKGQFREYREKLRGMTMADSFDEKEFLGVFREMTSLMESRALERAKLARDIKGVLTPAQFEQLQEDHEKYGKRRGMHRKGRHGGLDEWLQKGAE